MKLKVRVSLGTIAVRRKCCRESYFLNRLVGLEGRRAAAPFVGERALDILSSPLDEQFERRSFQSSWSEARKEKIGGLCGLSNVMSSSSDDNWGATLVSLTSTKTLLKESYTTIFSQCVM